MSLKTWKAKFYPTEACDCAKKDAVDHSLQKWIGLRPANLKKHGVRLYGASVVDLHDDPDQPCDSVDIDATSCSLCAHYYQVRNEGCGACPLAKARGNVACDHLTQRESALGIGAPYYRLLSSSPPNLEPMIRWLKKAKDHQ